jgi:predicted esterase
VWAEHGSFDGTPVFFGCSDRDAHIPEERVRASGAVFERMGASVTLRIYEGMGHAVNADEIAFARELLTTASA